MNAREPILLLLMVGLAAGTWWLANRDTAQAPALTDSATTIGYYLEEPTFEQTDANGQLTLRLRASRALEIDTQGTLQLLAPDVRYFPEPRRDWHLHAEQGRLTPDKNTVTLTGDVAMEAIATGPTTGAVVHTEALTIDIATERATTEAPLSLQFAKHRLAGEGMHADLKAGTLELQSKVHGLFTR